MNRQLWRLKSRPEIWYYRCGYFNTVWRIQTWVTFTDVEDGDERRDRISLFCCSYTQPGTVLLFCIKFWRQLWLTLSAGIQEGLSEGFRSLKVCWRVPWQQLYLKICQKFSFYWVRTLPVLRWIGLNDKQPTYCYVTKKAGGGSLTLQTKGGCKGSFLGPFQLCHDGPWFRFFLRNENNPFLMGKGVNASWDSTV